MSRQYSTTDSELSDIGDEMKELLMNNNKLRTEIDLLKKENKENEHTMSSHIKQLEIENEKLKSSVKSLEDLLKSFKNSKSNSVIVNNQQNKGNDSNNQILELEKKISDYENTIFHLKSTEQDLIRQNQALKRENSDLNLDIDKLKMNLNKNTNSNIYGIQYENLDNIDLDNMDDEKKLIIQELFKAYEETKKENQDLKENAINTLTEKEMANMELREQIEDLKNKYSKEVKTYLDQIHVYKTKLNDIEIDQSYYEGDDISFTKEETKELIEKYAKLEEEYNILKQECEEKEFYYETEKTKGQNEIERMIYNYKSTIFNLEQDISRYQQELSSYQMDKAELEREKEQDYENKNILVSELEKYQNKIRLLEENKDKIEHKYKEQIIYLNMQHSELDRQNTILKNSKMEAEKELIELKISFNNKIKDEKDKIKVDLISKDRENFSQKEKIENLEKESSNLKQNCDLSKKNYEKLKIEYNLIHENMKKIKELHENEIKKLEEKYILLERRYEKQLLYQDNNIIRSNSILCQTLPNIGSALPQKTRSTNVHSKLNQTNTTKSLMDALESADESSPQSQIIFLQNEVILLKDQITELNLKIYKFQNTKEDYDFLDKENKKLKSDIKDMEVLYEKQIEDLQTKTLNMNVELENMNKKRYTVSKRENLTNKKSLTNSQAIIENSEGLKLKAEIKFLQDKIEILNKELSNLKSLYEKDINFFKEQLKVNEATTVNAKISLATLAFEKDCEIIKYKNCVKKLRTRLNGIKSSDYMSNNSTSLAGSFFKKIFK